MKSFKKSKLLGSKTSTSFCNLVKYISHYKGPHNCSVSGEGLSHIFFLSAVTKLKVT